MSQVKSFLDDWGLMLGVVSMVVSGMIAVNSINVRLDQIELGLDSRFDNLEFQINLISGEIDDLDEMLTAVRSDQVEIRRAQTSLMERVSFVQGDIQRLHDRLQE